MALAAPVPAPVPVPHDEPWSSMPSSLAKALRGPLSALMQALCGLSQSRARITILSEESIPVTPVCCTRYDALRFGWSRGPCRCCTSQRLVTHPRPIRAVTGHFRRWHHCTLLNPTATHHLHHIYTLLSSPSLKAGYFHPSPVSPHEAAYHLCRSLLSAAVAPRLAVLWRPHHRPTPR